MPKMPHYMWNFENKLILSAFEALSAFENKNVPDPKFFDTCKIFLRREIHAIPTCAQCLILFGAHKYRNKPGMWFLVISTLPSIHIYIETSVVYNQQYVAKW